jgi:hypothetical protein
MQLSKVGDDLFVVITRFLDVQSIISFGLTCRDSYEALLNDKQTLWKLLCYRDYYYTGTCENYFEKHVSLQNFEQTIRNIAKGRQSSYFEGRSMKHPYRGRCIVQQCSAPHSEWTNAAPLIRTDQCSANSSFSLPTNLR